MQLSMRARAGVSRRPLKGVRGRAVLPSTWWRGCSKGSASCRPSREEGHTGAELLGGRADGRCRDRGPRGLSSAGGAT
eukprot:1918257-Alexandrium_andersonii.AAC.1